VIPALERYAPQALLISAGFDGHAQDPLGNLDLTDEAFTYMTATLVDLANHLADGQIVSVLEGGYNLEVLGRCAAAHVRLLTET
jgi:acetoin utilization deacetylase AcuC-like enzyme